ncbi:hypothetical protein [Nitratifractor sp.]
MKRIVIAFLLTAAVGSALFACMPLTPMASVILNKKGVVLKAPPAAWVEKAAKQFGAESIDVAEKGVTLRFPLKQVVDKIGTSVDLRPWFKEKSCVKNWDRFYRCNQEGRNGADEKLYRRLDDRFVRKILCQEECCGEDTKRDYDQKTGGRSKKPLMCEDPNFLKWDFWWKEPYRMELEAAIGTPAGFKDLKAAKASLHRINALLKKVLPGARFPEDFGEGRSEFEVYYENHRMLPPPKNIGDKMTKLLRMLQKEGYLQGLTDADIETIGRRTAEGKVVFYTPRGCESAVTIRPPWPRLAQKIARPGWHAVSISARLDFDRNGCPHFEFLK